MAYFDLWQNAILFCFMSIVKFPERNLMKWLTSKYFHERLRALSLHSPGDPANIRPRSENSQYYVEKQKQLNCRRVQNWTKLSSCSGIVKVAEVQKLEYLSKSRKSLGAPIKNEDIGRRLDISILYTHKNSCIWYG